MRKWIYTCFFALIIGCFLGSMCAKCERKEKFEIYQCFRIAAKDYERVTLKVVAQEGACGTDEIFGMVKDAYLEINQHPNELKILLYSNKNDLIDCKNYCEKVFYRNTD